MSIIRLYDAEKALKEIAEEQQKSIRRMYENLANDINKELKSLSGKDNISSILRTQYLNELKDQLKSESDKISKELESSIKNAMEQTAQVLVDENNRFLKSIGLDIKSSYSYVPKDIVERISTGKIYDSDWSLSKAIWGSNKKTNDDINNIIAKGVASNKPTYEIAKDLEKYVNPAAKKDWSWSKVYPNTSKVVDYNAQRLARTMVSHAYQQSFVATTKDNPFFTGYKWISGHTSRTCELCIARESNDEYGLGSGVFPKGELPLDHPNGLCTYGVVTTEDLSSISNKVADWHNSPDGTYPEIDKYAKSLGYKPQVVKQPTTTTRNYKTTKNGSTLNTKNWKSQLTQDELNAIKAYQNSTSQVNKLLAKGDDLSGWYKDLISNLDSGLAKNGLQKDVVVFRGGSLTDLGISSSFPSTPAQTMEAVKALIEKGELSYKGYMSTSLSKKTAEQFASNLTYEIRIPKGTNGGFISDLVANGNEQEVLLSRDHKFKIVNSKVTKDEYGWAKVHLILELIK